MVQKVSVQYKMMSTFEADVGVKLEIMGFAVKIYEGCLDGLEGCILACLDGYMNIAMEQTEEYVNGQLKNKYGDAFIRGNNVLYISTSKSTLAE
ncbi:Sm-like protein LSM36B, partial [Tanacetum coccineum]